MTPELQAALEWAEADEEQRDRSVSMFEDPDAQYARETDASLRALAAEVRRRERETCQNCEHRGTSPCERDWCCVMEDGNNPDDIAEGDVSMANVLCEVMGGFCGAFEPRKAEDAYQADAV